MRKFAGRRQVAVCEGELAVELGGGDVLHKKAVRLCGKKFFCPGGPQDERRVAFLAQAGKQRAGAFAHTEDAHVRRV